MTLNKLRSLLALTATSLLAGLYSCSSSNPELTIKLDKLAPRRHHRLGNLLRTRGTADRHSTSLRADDPPLARHRALPLGHLLA